MGRMDDLLLIEATERYLNGEMSSTEKAFFEDLRKRDPEVDQFVVEHIYFLQGMDNFGVAKSFKHTLHEVENKLLEEGFISEEKLKGKAKVVHLWNRYQRNIAVAASIAGLISLLTIGVMVTYTKKVGNDNIEFLVKKLNETNREVNKLKSRDINPPVSTTPQPVAPQVDYRATGFLIDGKGYIVTNSHVISKMKNIYVENKKGNYYKASAVYTDNIVDLAILKITDTAFKAINNLPYSIKK